MRFFMLLTLTMSFFAANSLLCRLALSTTRLDAQSFTLLRMVSGAVMLWILMWLRYRRRPQIGGSFKGAAALFGYMLAFSFSYRGMGAATGTLTLAVAVLLTTVAVSHFSGERATREQIIGSAVTFGGLLAMLTPSLTIPSLVDFSLMLIAGSSWAMYSILGKKSRVPALDTTGNFIRGVPLVALLIPFIHNMPFTGVLYAIVSGALASALGYVLWYRVVMQLTLLDVALVQLSVPVLTALGAWIFLEEAMTLRFIVCGTCILCGIAYTHIARIKVLQSSVNATT